MFEAGCEAGVGCCSKVCLLVVLKKKSDWALWSPAGMQKFSGSHRAPHSPEGAAARRNGARRVKWTRAKADGRGLVFVAGRWLD